MSEKGTEYPELAKNPEKGQGEAEGDAAKKAMPNITK